MSSSHPTDKGSPSSSVDSGLFRLEIQCRLEHDDCFPIFLILPFYSFLTSHKCVFDRKVTKDVESATKYVTEYKVAGFTTGKHTDKVVTKVDEYFWTFTANWELFIYQGADPNDR